MAETTKKKRRMRDKRYANYSGADGGKGWKTKEEGNNGRLAVSAKKRFQNRVEVLGNQDTGCWLWKGKLDKYGRGQISVVYEDGVRQTFDVRKYAWYLKYNQHPSGPLRTKCSHANCVNPDHLQLKRVVEKRAQRVFTDDEVRDIRRRYDNKESMKSIYERYPHAAQHSVYCAARRISYKSIPEGE